MLNQSRVTPDNSKVSVILTALDVQQHKLDRMLFSIESNNYCEKEVIIVCLGRNKDDINRIKTLISWYPKLNCQLIINPTEKHTHAEHLDIALQQRTGRYLCFLDNNAIFYPNHFEVLTKILHKTEYVWGYAQVDIQFEENSYYIVGRSQLCLPESGMFAKSGNADYIPLNAVMIDTINIGDPSLLVFGDLFDVLTSQAFLAFLAEKYPPIVSPIVTSTRFIPSYLRETIMQTSPPL